MSENNKLSEIMNNINENLQINNFKEAASLAQLANEMSPNNFEILLILAICCQRMEDFKSAIKFYKLSIKCNEEYIASYDRLIDLLIERSPYNKNYIYESIFYIEVVNKIDPNNYERIFKYGSQLLLIRDFDRAEIFFKDLIEKDSKNVSYQYKLAETYSKKGKGLEAISLINKFFSLTKKQYLNLMEQIAYAYFSIEDFPRAKKEYYKILADKNITHKINNKIRENVYCNLCEVFRITNNINDHDEYEKICKEAISLYPENIFLKKQLLYLSIYLDNEEKCCEIINFLTAKDPESRDFAGLNLYLSHEYKNINITNFCKNPFDGIRNYNLDSLYENSNSTIHSIVNSINELPKIYDYPFKSDIGAERTQTNLYNSKDPNLIELFDKIIILLDTYREDIAEDISGYYLDHWPEDIYIDAWAMIAKEGAFHFPHNHTSSWVSGVLYLNTPNNPDNNEGSISFTTSGYKLPNKNKPFEKIFKPNPGDIILFPSHLYHYTLPHSNIRERICLPFNIIKSFK